MDNCGGASWFVILAAEKNEQINDLSNPLLWNYRSFGVSPIAFTAQERSAQCYPYAETETPLSILSPRRVP